MSSIDTATVLENMTLAGSKKQIEFKQLRERAGLTLAEALDLLKVDRRTVYRYETGETKPSRLALGILREAAQRATPPTPSSRALK
jgi:DNA (cytosine-5)-methyltransferase 1